ncbi:MULTISPECIES: TauD/TfdA family dioxygenase [unclassified Pseudofrankia]|uniref:TauD/TfdA family dioxygenase n=1 Tax=unclassified Pseudofrankia TaxID=2994372 RepID=UPI0008DABC65|nr:MULTISPECIES: TauD/TfdA family dioxygenase [unclassified Pseudofrankia]MDT3440102.1 TauD/TfdA family dioxygenase [Pseudofrankia sp. BMG5.37]OHV44714.1 taurine dioxygenase [Pseudofrankia sp. BMG5.36]
MSTTTSPTLEPVRGPFVWRGDQLSRTDEWIFRLSGDQVAELEEAGRRFVADDPDLRFVTAAEYPLPVCAGAVRVFGADLDSGRGFVLIRGLRMDDYDDALAAAIFYLLALHLGEPMRQNLLGDVLDHIVGVSNKKYLEGGLPSRTRDKLPFHSDSSDAVALMCLRPPAAGGLSSLVSGATVYNEVLARRPDLAPLLLEPWHYDWRRQDPNAPADTYTSPIVSWTQGTFSMYAGGDMIESAHRYPGVPPLTAAQKELLALVEEITYEPGVALDMDFQPGDIQWLLNYAALHSRTEFVNGPDRAHQRHLLRIWLRRNVDRPLVPRFGKHVVVAAPDARQVGPGDDTGRFRIADAATIRERWGD